MFKIRHSKLLWFNIVIVVWIKCRLILRRLFSWLIEKCFLELFLLFACQFFPLSFLEHVGEELFVCSLVDGDYLHVAKIWDSFDRISDGFELQYAKTLDEHFAAEEPELRKPVVLEVMEVYIYWANENQDFKDDKEKHLILNLRALIVVELFQVIKQCNKRDNKHYERHNVIGIEIIFLYDFRIVPKSTICEW